MFKKCFFFFGGLLDKYKEEMFLMKKDSMRQPRWISPDGNPFPEQIKEIEYLH